MLNISVEAFDKNNLNEIFEKMIDSFIQNHKLSQSAHEEIMAMVHSDKTVAFYFRKQEMEMTIKIYDLLVKSGFTDNNLMEKSHIAIGMIDNLCHEIVYHKHTELNYDIMTNICINTIIDMLNKKLPIKRVVFLLRDTYYCFLYFVVSLFLLFLNKLSGLYFFLN